MGARPLWLSALLASLLVCSALRAQDQAAAAQQTGTGVATTVQASGEPAAQLFTLAQALNYALEHYPAVRASLEEINAARAAVKLARTQYLPQLSGVYQDSRATQNQVPGIWLPTPITPTVEGPIGSYSGQSFWGSQGAALFSWEPFDFGLRGARVTQARTAEERSQTALTLTQLEVAAAVADYFLLAASNHRAALAAQANVDRWGIFDKAVHTLVDNELRAGADASRADVELARAETQLYQAQQAEYAALDTLAALLGAAGKQIQLDAHALATLPRAQEPAETAATQHPLAREQMDLVREMRARENLLKHSDYPRFYLQSELLGRGSDVPNGASYIGAGHGLAPGRANWVAGITILFPDLFGLKALGAEKEMARADERSQQARYDQALEDLTGKIEQARHEWRTAELIAERTPGELAAAGQLESQSRARYQSGLATMVEVAEAENLLAQAEMDDAVAKLNVWHALFDVAAAEGDLRPFLHSLEGATGGGN